MSLEEYKGVYIFAQQVDNEISSISLELLGKAKGLAADLDESVTAILVGYQVKNLADKLAEYGADKVIVVDDPELKNQVADATSSKLIGINHFTKQAPVHIVVVEESVNLSSGFGSLVKDKKFAHVDIGITAAHLCLAAEDEGLGTCIIGWFNESKVRKLLNIPSGKRVLLDIVVGYSLQPDRPKKRKEKDKVISFNSYE